jgi:hypothetical protein
VKKTRTFADLRKTGKRLEDLQKDGPRIPGSKPSNLLKRYDELLEDFLEDEERNIAHLPFSKIPQKLPLSAKEEKELKEIEHALGLIK